MTNVRRIVVTAGPTIGAADIHAVLPNAEVVKPISFGDPLSYNLASGDTLLIIDGLFFQRPAVRHKELLTLMADGVRVVGSSSMGALRAAELHQFGMEGYGWVFEAYRDGVLDADDEVGMVHGGPEDGYPVFVDALVNTRHTVAKAVETGVLTPEMGTRIIEEARRTPFAMRSWNRLLDNVKAPEVHILARTLRTLRVDVKHADALVALQAVADDAHRGPARQGPPETMWSQRWRQRFAPGGVDEVSDFDVLSMLSVCATDRWAYLPALEQIAAWHWSSSHPADSGSVRDRAAKAVRDVDPGTYEHALEAVAHEHAQTVGVVDEFGFSAQVRAHWLTADEEQALRDNPVAVSARILTRTLFAAPSLPAVEYFLQLLREDPRLPQWRELAAAALALRDDVARRQPQLNVHRPDPARLKQLYGALWGTPADHIEQARRGLLTDEAFYTAATPFAVAAATNELPRFEVGTLGGVPVPLGV